MPKETEKPKDISIHWVPTREYLHQKAMEKLNPTKANKSEERPADIPKKKPKRPSVKKP